MWKLVFIFQLMFGNSVVLESFDPPHYKTLEECQKAGEQRLEEIAPIVARTFPVTGEVFIRCYDLNGANTEDA